MSNDLTCVYKGLDGCGSIFISGLSGASNICFLRGIYPIHKAAKIKAIVTVTR